MVRSRMRLSLAVVAALFTALGISISGAQTVETVYSLPDTGTQSRNSLVKTPSGSFLGTALFGGSAGFGTIFEVTPQGEINRRLSFNGDNGLYPETSLILASDGKYYGVASGGG